MDRYLRTWTGNNSPLPYSGEGQGVRAASSLLLPRALFSPSPHPRVSASPRRRVSPSSAFRLVVQGVRRSVQEGQIPGRGHLKTAFLDQRERSSWTALASRGIGFQPGDLGNFQSGITAGFARLARRDPTLWPRNAWNLPPCCRRVSTRIKSGFSAAHVRRAGRIALGAVGGRREARRRGDRRLPARAPPGNRQRYFRESLLRRQYTAPRVTCSNRAICSCVCPCRRNSMISRVMIQWIGRSR